MPVGRALNRTIFETAAQYLERKGFNDQSKQRIKFISNILRNNLKDEESRWSSLKNQTSLLIASSKALFRPRFYSSLLGEFSDINSDWIDSVYALRCIEAEWVTFLEEFMNFFESVTIPSASKNIPARLTEFLKKHFNFDSYFKDVGKRLRNSLSLLKISAENKFGSFILRNLYFHEELRTGHASEFESVLTMAESWGKNVTSDRYNLE